MALTACAEQNRRPASQLPPANIAMRNTSTLPSNLPAGPGAEAASREDVRQDFSKQVFPGSGRVVGGRPSAVSRSAVNTEGDITLNFVNADVKDVARAVLGDILQVNFAIDPKLQGNITLQTNRPVNKEAVLPILEGALRLSGVGLVRNGDVYTVAQSNEVLRYGAGTGRSSIPMADQSGYNIRVVPLSYVSAEEIAGLLKSFMPQESVIRTIPSRNVLLLGGSQGEIATMMETVGIFDVNWMTGMSFGMFTPRNVDAKTMAKELEVIFGLTIRQTGAAPIRILPIERINAVLAIASTTEALREIESWVDRLDRGAENVDARVYVYYVQNGRAADLATALTGLLGEGGDSGAGRSGSRPDPGSGRAGLLTGASPTSGAVIASGTATEGGAAISRGESSLGGDGGIRLGTLGGMRLKADEVNNALLILATPREYRVIEAALAKLDIPPLQVMIEAVVAEVTLTDELRYGVQWLFQPGAQTFTLSQAATGAVNPVFPGFSAVLAKGNDIRATLNLLEGITNVNVVSSPKLMVLNNQTATLQVGDQVPIATQSAVSVGAAGAPVVNTIQFRDTGVILKVTPRVNEGGLVLMDISQEVSDVARTTTSNLDSPTIQQRKISSSVSVTTGETIALGGLIRDRRVDGDSGIPILKDVPVFGNLFKSTTETTARTELLILITPQVVRAPADIRRVTQELRDRLRIPPGMLGEQ